MKFAPSLALALLALAAGVTTGRPVDDRAGVATPEFTWRAMDGVLERPVETVVFSADGKLVAAGAQDTILVWDAATGKAVTRMLLPSRQPVHRLAFTADGRLVSDCREDPLVRVWDVKTGKQTHEWRHPNSPHGNGRYWSPFMAFAPDARLVAVEGRKGDPAGVHGADLLDAATGAQVAHIDSWLVAPRHGYAFSPDGRRLACNGDGDGLTLWDTATGKLVRQVRAIPPVGATGRAGGGQYVRFSPDGRFLVAREYGAVVATPDPYRAVIWGAADGKRYAHFDQYRGPTRLSADNRYLLTGSESVHNLMTDRAVPVANAVKGRTLLAASADGKTLAYLGEAAGPGPAPARWLTVFLTPAPTLPPPVAEAGDLSPDELDLLYGGWASVNGFAQDYAGRMLAARPEQAVAHVAPKLKPVPDLQRLRIEDAIRRLDGDAPNARDVATAELRKVAFEFQPLLAAARTAAAPGEVRNRLISVLEPAEGVKSSGTPATEAQRLEAAKQAGLPPGLPTPAKLADELRAVALLERVASPEARAVLTALAAGAAGARVTDEARDALRRLKPAAK